MLLFELSGLSVLLLPSVLVCWSCMTCPTLPAASSCLLLQPQVGLPAASASGACLLLLLTVLLLLLVLLRSWLHGNAGHSMANGVFGSADKAAGGSRNPSNW